MPVRKSRAERRCEELCQKLEQCKPGSGTGCITRCLNDRSSDREFTAIDGCKTQRCGRGFNGCVLRRAGIDRNKRDCAPLCEKKYACQNPGRDIPLSELIACTSACKSGGLERAAGKKCESKRCGAEYEQCFAKASTKPPTREEKQCTEMCAQAVTCGSLKDKQQCYKRCLSDKTAKTEFRLRRRCIKASCDTYESCIVGGLGIPKAKKRYIPVCRHQLMCKSKGPLNYLALASCARSGKKPASQISAITQCAPAGCDTAFRICVESKLRAITNAPPPPKKLSRREKRCIKTCEKMASCEPGNGGEKCVADCLGGKRRDEFAARGNCNSKACGDYTVCIARNLGVPRRKLSCVDACSHELSCLPPGEPRGLTQLVRCARRCKHSNKMLAAIGACQVKGCGGAFKMCVAEKTGALQKKKAVLAQCETVCKKDVECRKGRSATACIKRCVDSNARNAEFGARKTCVSRSCDQWDSCIMDALKVTKRGRRCLDSCRWDLQCARGGDQSDQLQKLASCMNTCRYTEQELTVRSDCQYEGCGSKFRMCVDKGLLPSKPASDGQAGANSGP